MNDRLQAAGMMLRRSLPRLFAQLQSRLSERLQTLGQQTSGRMLRELAQRVPVLAELLAPYTPQSASRAAPQKPIEPRPVEQRVVAPRTAPPVDELTTPALLGDLHSAEDFEVRLSVVRTLGQRGGAQETAGLIVALRDSSVEVACAAAEELARVAAARNNARAALWQVVDNMDGYYNALVRGAAVVALGQCVADGELPGIFRLVEDADAEVSVAAISVVLSRAPDQAPSYLLPILVNGQGYYLPVARLAAARALERSGALGEDALSDLLQRESDPAVRGVLQRIQPTRYN